MSVATDMLAKYLEAEIALLAGKTTRINTGGTDRWLTLEDLDKIIAGRKEWERRVQIEEAKASGNRIGRPIQVVL
jgi:hypothetical protein